MPSLGPSLDLRNAPAADNCVVEDEEQGEAGDEAKSLKCEDCGKILRNEV